MLTTDAVLSKTPGACRVPSGRRFTVTSVPTGKTVSRWAANTNVGPPPVPRRRIVTLPMLSVVVVKPSFSNSACTSAARARSWPDGAGTSVKRIHSSSWRSKCRSTNASAARTSARSTTVSVSRVGKAGCAPAGSTVASSTRARLAAAGGRIARHDIRITPLVTFGAAVHEVTGASDDDEDGEHDESNGQRQRHAALIPRSYITARHGDGDHFEPSGSFL
jgi:hypothetical protein